MLDRQRGEFIFECDVCGDVLNTDAHKFDDAREALSNAGWKARKIGSDWIHSCAGCGEPGARAPLARSGRML